MTGPARRGVLLAATYHQLVMAQALARMLHAELGELAIVWTGGRPLEALRHLILPHGDTVRFADCHGHRRLAGRVWREGPAVARSAEAAYRSALGGNPAAAAVFSGNDSELFTQVALRASGLDWSGLVLYEEGIGFYVGTSPRRLPERAAVNLLLAARRVPFAIPLRDFSLNPRIRRLACNHPELVRRSDVTTLNTADAYVAALRELAPLAGGPGGRTLDALYVSGNFSEAGHMSEPDELRLLARVHATAMRTAGASCVHVKFHPLDSSAKRRRMLDLGFVELALDAPIELGCLADHYRHVFSFRSSTVLNVSLLEIPDTRFWLFRSRSDGARALRRRSIDRLFRTLVGRHGNLAFLDLD